jgi:ribosome biogenesis protein Tsr3
MSNHANADHPTLFILKETTGPRHVVYATCDAEEAMVVYDEWEDYHKEGLELIECSWAKDMAGWRPIMPPNKDLEWAD